MKRQLAWVESRFSQAADLVRAQSSKDEALLKRARNPPRLAGINRPRKVYATRPVVKKGQSLTWKAGV